MPATPGDVIVIKLGGTEGVDFESICLDVKALLDHGKQLVLVHGGSAETNALGEALGHPPRFVTSPSGFTSRYTDRKTLDIFGMAVNGKINTGLVEALHRLGVNAFGLSGLDGALIRARRKQAIRIIENGKQKMLRDDFTGKITEVNGALLETLLSSGCLPVVAPMAISEAGEALNVDADRAAAMVAAAISASHLILLTAAPGLLRKFPDEASRIDTIAADQIEDYFKFAQGRMKKKVLAAQEALQGNVGQVIIADGRIDSPIQAALAGQATTIR
jgi:acetylglutamate/LysW-gamma-L-alpha-aminoadipate kinase